jgi:ribonuclease P protein component
VPEQGLSRRERLKGRVTIQKVLKTGRLAEDGLLVLRFVPGATGTGRRIGIGTSRQIRGAVRRNRARRRLRAVYRAHRDRLPPDGDYFLIARRASENASFPELSGSFQRLADAFRD